MARRWTRSVDLEGEEPVMAEVQKPDWSKLDTNKDASQGQGAQDVESRESGESGK
ncbi:hypothetical protein GCM10023195_84050 [Actinoallomurus liliacearum]|uniref:Uncharacterized protein n=1 Tax=Actinoallomurus liliacearum TaxID=1080073 RepID=A0ABP8U0J1_9ACTN